ncbi:MAG: polyprenyl diphosphate synthase [Candidatus Dormibacteraceae bacterium]
MSVSVPGHVGIIMDGNGRWAAHRGLSPEAGHRAGVEAVKRVMSACQGMGIEVLSVYVFSTENWSRPQEEVRSLMRLFHDSIQSELEELLAQRIRVVFSGRREELSPRMREQIAELERQTVSNQAAILNVCLNYGGRAELVDACRALLRRGLQPQELSEEKLAAELYHPELPDPDLIIRTAGEHRLSNFLLWQAAYAELYVTETLWPDFGEADLKLAVAEYQTRVRNFGGRPDKS